MHEEDYSYFLTKNSIVNKETWQFTTLFPYNVRENNHNSIITDYNGADSILLCVSSIRLSKA